MSLAATAVFAAYGEDFYSDGWTCFGENYVVKYQDTGNPVPLPRYIFHAAQWDSWEVTNAVAVILIKEKLGVDVFQCIDVHPDGLPCYKKWPGGIYDEMENHRVDANLEAWEVSTKPAKVQQRVYDKKVLEYGFVGYSFEAFFTAGKDPTWDLGNYKTLFKQSVKDTVLSTMTPVFDEFKGREGGVFKRYDGWTSSVSESKTYPSILADSNTVITKPFLMGIGWNWGSTMWLWDAMHQHGLDAEWDIWYIKSEALTNEIIARAEALNAKWIVDIWEPGYALGKYKAQRVSLNYPQVPGCSETGDCDMSTSSLTKYVSTNIDRIPEVATFLNRFTFAKTSELGMIITDHVDNGIKWKEAACNYLKSTNHWEAWIVPIVRNENEDPWWKIYVEIGAILCACIFLGTLITVAWRQLSGESAGEIIQEEKMKKEAAIDMMMMAGVIAFDIIDVICSSWATATCFEIAGDNVLLVVGFCVALVLEIGCGIFVSLQRITVIKELRAKYNGTWLNEEGDADHKSAKMHKRTEALMFIAGLGEDLPWLVLYVIVMIMGYLEPAFVAGAGMSFTGFGYKLSSLEKHFLYKKMEGYTAQLLYHNDVKSKEN